MGWYLRVVVGRKVFIVGRGIWEVVGELYGKRMG